jgi:uncharacterized protein YlxW (UPF0749 family)
MEVAELAALAGGVIGLLTVVGGVIARDRSLIGTFTAMVNQARDEADKEAKALHERINRVRDEYSKRTDLDAHVQQMNVALQGLAAEVRTHTQQSNTRLDNLVAVLVERAKSG